MRALILAAVLAASTLGAAQAAMPPAVTDASGVAPDGSRTLKLTIDIAAPPARVWAQFVDLAAIKAGGVTDAWIDLRNGGLLEQAIVPGQGPGSVQNIRHEIIAYLPDRLMVLRNLNTPPGLPGREAYKRIIQIVQVEDLGGGRSRLSLIGTGYIADPQFDALYSFFHEHNGDYLVGVKSAAEKAAAGG